MPETVILTGITGFIAKHIAAQLIDAGYAVRGTLRSAKREAEVRSAVADAVKDASLVDERLSFAEVDLMKDDGWDDAMAGGDVLLHTASPFPIAQPGDENELIRPAVDGTLRALRAAHQAGIKRVVLTSSMAAVMNKTKAGNPAVYDHTDWTDVDAPMTSPYDKSKTLAERAAWDFVENEAPQMQLTTINPGLVLGPSLDAHFGSSLEIVERVLRAKDPAVPNVSIPTVDVRDVAKMHVSAISADDSIGKRCLAVADDMSFPQMAKILADAYPNRKISSRTAPNWLIKILALFDSEAKAIVPVLGLSRSADTRVSRQVLGISFIPAKEAVLASAESVLKFKSI